MKKESVNKFDLEAAFKALEEIEVPVVKGIKPNRENLQEKFTKKSTTEILVEDYFDVNDQGDLEAAQEEREAEIAKAKLARIEKIVDLDAESEEDLLPSYVGKFIIQCPQCMTLFYKNQEDIEKSEENPEVVNINEVCQHCGNTSGYTLIGKVDNVGEEEAENYDVEDFDENELNLDFDAEEPVEEESAEEEPVEDETAEEGNEEELELEPVEETEEENSEEEEKVEESLKESVDKELDDKLKAHNEYIEYLKDMIEKEEKSLASAKNDFVKKSIQSRIDALQADLEAALPEALKGEVEAELPTAEEIDLEATENTEEKEETKESLTEDLVKIEGIEFEDPVIIDLGDTNYGKIIISRKDIELAKQVDAKTNETWDRENGGDEDEIIAKINSEGGYGIHDWSGCELFCHYADIMGLEFSLADDDSEGEENYGKVTPYKESLAEAIQKNPNISEKEINKILNDKNLSQEEKVEKLYEDVKIISDLSDYSPWSGAVDTWNQIKDENKVTELDSMLEEIYPDGLTMTELNDILWFDSEWVLSSLGIIEEVEESLAEDTAVKPRVRHQSRREIFSRELATHPAFEGISTRDLERYIIDLYLEDDPTAELDVEQVVEYVEDLGWGKIILDNIDNLSEGQVRHFAQKDPVFVSTVKEFLGDWLIPNKNYSVGALVSELLAFLGKKPADKEEAKDFTFDPNDISYKELKDDLASAYYEAKELVPVTESLTEAGDLNTLLDSEEFKKPISEAEVENILAKYESLEEEIEPGIESELAIQDIVDTWESVEEIDEESLDKLTENYLTEVYSNVKSFKTTDCSLAENKLVVEGKITFNSGKSKSTKFIYEATKTDNNKVVLEGLNADFATEKAFILNCNLDTANRLVVESLNYKYTINNTLVEGLTK